TGDTGTFSTTASGTGPFNYQWTDNGVVIPGATNSNYTVGPVSAGDAGTYCVIISGAANSVTNCATLTVNVPTTGTGPDDLVLVTGDTGTFSTTASGTGPFNYQWTDNGVVIPGATNSSYTVGPISAGDAGTNCVIISGAANTVTNCATLTVNAPTTATGHDDLVLVTADTGTFSTTASGTGPFNYQWTDNGVVIPGATNSSYTVGPVSAGDAGTYCVIISVAANSVTNCATLTVNTPTSGTGPDDLVLVTGDTGTFSTTASGTGPFNYQWTDNGVVMLGATNSSYTVGPVSAGDAGTYCVIISGAANSVTNCATLTVNTPTSGTGPDDLVLVTGDTGTFSTTASGTGPFNYQWTDNGVVIPGATNSNYTVGPVSAGDAGTYCVIISGAANSVTNCATLTVNMPTTTTGPDDLVLVTGDTGTFSTTASGTGPFNYQWTDNGVVIPVANHSSYSVGPVCPDFRRTHFLFISGAANSVTNCATLTVNAPTTATG